jgi:hypothetical protein
MLIEDVDKRLEEKAGNSFPADNPKIVTSNPAPQPNKHRGFVRTAM